MFWGKALRNPWSHARIVRIDTREAEALPGVLAVLTARDLPNRHPHQTPRLLRGHHTLRLLRLFADRLFTFACVFDALALFSSATF
jgi:CO/xanthine dehydrogenase Mo-binding subunit